jgi:hypothetical protein
MNQYLTPTEIDQLVQRILDAVDQQAIPPAQRATLQDALATFAERWQVAAARFGQQAAGELAYRDALLFFQEAVAPLARPWLAEESMGHAALTALETMLVNSPPAPRRFNRQVLAQVRQQRRTGHGPSEPFQVPNFERPVFIVSAPRAGSTLLFETVARFPGVWTIGRESHDLETDIPELHPATRQYASNRLTAADATSTISTAVQHWFSRRLQDTSGNVYRTLPAAQQPATIRFVEKTPKNALRIPFLKAIFPNARFIFLYREPRQNISSLLEGWRSRRFVAYRDMPGWPYKEWNFLLIPGWQQLTDCPLAEIAARQWRVANEQILADLQALSRDDWLFVTYQALIEQPAATIQQIRRFASFGWGAAVEQAVSAALPLSHMVVSPPAPDKWRQHEAEMSAVLPMVQPVIEQLAALIDLEHTNQAYAE